MGIYVEIESLKTLKVKSLMVLQKLLLMLATGILDSACLNS